MFTVKSILAFTALTLGLTVQVVSATADACPGAAFLFPKNGKCVCEKPFGGVVAFKTGCGADLHKFYGVPYCDPFCHQQPQHSPKPHHPKDKDHDKDDDHKGDDHKGHRKRAVPRRVLEETFDDAIVDNTDSQSSPCPKPDNACPIFANNANRLALKADDFECVNINEDLDNCGGCTSVGLGESCVDIPGIRGTACIKGKCQIYSCKSGYKRVIDPKSKKELCVPL
jgi:hypothetical protein